jgi:hypothetical protein
MLIVDSIRMGTLKKFLLELLLVNTMFAGSNENFRFIVFENLRVDKRHCHLNLGNSLTKL